MISSERHSAERSKERCAWGRPSRTKERAKSSQGRACKPVAHHAFTWGPHALGLGKDVAVSLFVNWLYDKLKRHHVNRIRVNHQNFEVTGEGLVKIFLETFETDDN